MNLRTYTLCNYSPKFPAVTLACTFGLAEPCGKAGLNEYDLDLLRQRSLAARYEKAHRGELVVAAPVGFVKVGDRLEMDPDRRVKAAIRLTIDKAAELGSVRQALLWLMTKWRSRAQPVIHSTRATVRRPGHRIAPTNRARAWRHGR